MKVFLMHDAVLKGEKEEREGKREGKRRERKGGEGKGKREGKEKGRGKIQSRHNFHRHGLSRLHLNMEFVSNLTMPSSICVLQPSKGFLAQCSNTSLIIAW